MTVFVFTEIAGLGDDTIWCPSYDTMVAMKGVVPVDCSALTLLLDCFIKPTSRGPKGVE